MESQNIKPGQIRPTPAPLSKGVEPAPFKHQQLYDIILSAQNIIIHLHELRDRIEGSPSNRSEEAIKNPYESVSLSQLLNNGSGILSDKIKSAHKVISDIDNLLFTI